MNLDASESEGRATTGLVPQMRGGQFDPNRGQKAYRQRPPAVVAERLLERHPGGTGVPVLLDEAEGIGIVSISDSLCRPRTYLRSYGKAVKDDGRDAVFHTLPMSDGAASSVRSRFDSRIVGLLVVALLVRLYGLWNPLTEAGHERQTQVAMIARNILRDHYAFLYTRLDVFGLDPGYIALEFPLQPLLMALAHGQGVDLDLSGRVVSIAFSLLSVLLMHGIARRFLSPGPALFTTAVYALSPMSIFFGRAVYPEPLLMFFLLGSVLTALLWRESGRPLWLLLSGCAAGMSCILKGPVGLPMCLPLAAVWYLVYGRSVVRRIGFYLYFAGILGVTVLWAKWAGSIGPADPGWNAYQLSAIARWGIPHAWFTGRFYSFVLISLVGFALTPLPFLMALAGLRRLGDHPLRVVLLTWTIAMVVFVFGTPGGQATHWNYQVPLIAIGALLAGLALEPLVRWWRTSWSSMARGSAVVLCILVYGGIYTGAAYYAYDTKRRIPHAIEVGEATRQFLPAEGFLILVQPMMVPTSQAYYMDRRVRALRWEGKENPPSLDDIKRFMAEGAVGLVAVDTPYGRGTQAVQELPGFQAFIDENFVNVASGEGYILFRRRISGP